MPTWGDFSPQCGGGQILPNIAEVAPKISPSLHLCLVCITLSGSWAVKNLNSSQTRTQHIIVTDNCSISNHIQGTWFEYPQFNSNSNFQVYDWLARWSQDLVSCNCTGFRNYESDLDARYHPFETLEFFRGSIIGQIFRWLMSVSLRFEPHIKFNCDLWLYYDFFGKL